MLSTDDIAVAIKTARKNAGLSQPELAKRVSKAGRPCSQQTIDKIETGKVKTSSFLPQIAVELGIPIDRVLRLGHNGGSGAAIAGRIVQGDRDLPVYAASQRGTGVQVLTQDPVEYVSRPEPLARVRDGYGVMVLDDTMMPEFRAGDIALVNPHKPPRSGDTCVFRVDNSDDTQVVIRYLRKVDDDNWHVTEWSHGHDGAKRDYKLPRSTWALAHVTVGSYKRL